jgi:hypothetical protein
MPYVTNWTRCTRCEGPPQDALPARLKVPLLQRDEGFLDLFKGIARGVPFRAKAGPAQANPDFPGVFVAATGDGHRSVGATELTAVHHHLRTSLTGLPYASNGLRMGHLG